VCNVAAAVDGPCGEVIDNCPAVSNAGQGDADEDGVGNACDDCIILAGADCSVIDPDGDNFCNTRPAAGVGNACTAALDNCPALANDQGDFDGDLFGDACDDSDGDGENDDVDNCRSAANADQADGDDDGVGDVCDNCHDDANDNQLDSNGDGNGDVCGDIDVDTVVDTEDNCVNVSNTNQADGDSDGVGDVCDNCDDVDNASQADADADGVGDACDRDVDGDGFCNTLADRDAANPGCIGVDNCPDANNPSQDDDDSDGIGDLCDISVYVPTLIENVDTSDEAPQDIGFITVGGVVRVNAAMDTVEEFDGFTVTAAQAGTLQVTMTMPNGSDYDLIVVQGGAQDGQGAQSGNPELAFFTVAAGESLLLTPNFYSGAAGTYTIEVRLLGDVETFDVTSTTDAVLRKPDFPQAPIALTVSGRVDVGSGDVTGNWTNDDAPDESDIVKIDILSSGTLSLSLGFEAGADLDMLVWNVAPNAGFAGIASQAGAGASNPEAATTAVTAGQTIYVSIHRFALAPGQGAYTLTATIE
jgi:hypothetical protein